MLNDADLAAAISLLFKKQEDSKAIYRYGLKRELIAKAIGSRGRRAGKHHGLPNRQSLHHHHRHRL
jgi:hypothetical protein